MIPVILALFIQSASAQFAFQKTFGDPLVNNNGYSLVRDGDGGYLVAGTQFNGGNAPESAYLLRINGVGDTVWTRKIREASLDYSAGKIIRTGDDGFILAGIKGGLTAYVPYLMKIDSMGSVLWNKSYLWLTQERIYTVVETPDAGFLMAGFFYNGSNDLVYFIRTDANGDTLWTRTYGEANHHADVYSVTLSSDGGFVAAGSIQDITTQDVDAFLMKTDSTGNLQWSYGYGGAAYDYAQCVEATADGGYVLAAVTYSFAYSAYWLVKTDANGNIEWSRAYGGNSDDRSESVKELPGGGFLIAGESASFSAGNFNCFLIRTDSQGDSIWTMELGLQENNEAYGLELTDDGGYLLAGYRTNANGRNDLLLVKGDLNGMMGCTGRSISPFVINTSLVVTTTHALAPMPAQPGVYSYNLTSGSGTTETLLCLDDRVEKAAAVTGIALSPIPVHSALYIAAGSDAGPVHMRIYSSDGSFILERYLNQLPGELSVDVLQPGIYFIRFETGKGVFHRHFIKS